MRRWATLVVLLACCCAAAAGTEAGGRSTALLPGLRKALRTKLAVKAGLAAASSGGARRKAAGLRMRRGTLFRCRFEGEPTLHIKDAEGGYYLHRFTAAECTGGQLPSGRCFSALHRTYHCGEDEQWGLVSPAEAEGPAVTWYNHSPCPRGLAKVTADFWCPDREDEVELHQCMFDGRPEKLTAAAGADDACTGPGRYRHAFHARECFNGLPKPGRLCAVSLRRMEHCGGDHDWAASNNSLPSVPGMAWFTSHTCARAHATQLHARAAPGSRVLPQLRRGHRGCRLLLSRREHAPCSARARVLTLLRSLAQDAKHRLHRCTYQVRRRCCRHISAASALLTLACARLASGPRRA